MGLELERIDYHPTGYGYEPSPPVKLSGIEKPSISHEAYLSKLDEINDSFRIIQDPYSERCFEVAVVNQHKLGEEAILFPSTHFSSLTQNPGNAIELAAHGAANPGAARIYVAYPGVGGTDRLLHRERKHIARTGRFTYGSRESGEQFRPLMSLVSMAIALAQEELVPNHITGDESGGRLGIGLMAAMKPGTIKDAYLNGIPGISPKANYSTAMVKEDVSSRVRRRAQPETQPGEITPDGIKEAKSRLPKIYKGLGHSGLLLGTYVQAPLTLPANVRAFRGHNDLSSPLTHGALQDTVAALVNQEANITLQFNRESSIHELKDCVRFGKLVMDRIPELWRSDKRALSLLIGTGTLDSHTDVPQERWRTESYALSY